MSGLSITAQARENFGKAEVRRLRKTGQMPAIVYGGEEDPKAIQVRHDDMLHSLENEAFYSSILTLEVDGQEEEVVLRDVERHPAKAVILHADFKRVVRGVEMTMNVPIHYMNAETAVGVKAGGMLDTIATEVEISCLPRNLPESIEIDVAEMEIGDVITLTGMTLPEGVNLALFAGMTEEEIVAHDQPIVSLQEQRVVEEPEEETEGVEAAGEEGAAADASDDDGGEAAADDSAE